MREFILCCLIVCLLEQRRVVGWVFISKCYGPQYTLPISCPDSRRILIRHLAHGFKLNTVNCLTDNSCCDLVKGDCRQFETEVLSDLNGHVHGVFSTSSIARQSCNSSYSAMSTYFELGYHCVDRNRILEMCTDVSAASTSEEMIYLTNRGYPYAEILPEDKSCTCSIKSSTASGYAYVFIGHLDLYDDSTNCLQSLTFSSMTGYVVRRFQCETRVRASSGVVVNSTLTLDNAHTSYGGIFWIGLNGYTNDRQNISINCSAATVKGCGNPTYGVYSTVAKSSTVYGSIATYTCFEKFVFKSGNLRRHCLQNGQWNGTAITCIYDCGDPSSPWNGRVDFNGTVTNDVARYTCDPGYTLIGVANLTCVHGTGWDGRAPICRKDCGTPASGDYSTVTISNTVYSFVAEYSCIDDYVYASGDTQRSCKEDGQWSGTALVCAEAGTGTTGPSVWIIVGAAFGALAVGILVGVTGLFVCRRLKRHRALPTNHEMVQTGTRRPDVSDGHINLGAIDISTSDVDVDDRREYQTLEFDDVKPDHTYATLSA